MMRIARVFYFTLNVLLVSNRYYIKSSGLMLDRTNMTIGTQAVFNRGSEGIQFVLVEKTKRFWGYKEITSCDLELVGFVVPNETESPTIKGMVCKVTTKDCQIDEISSPCAQHYYAYFTLGDKDIIEKEDFFKIAVIVKNANIYSFGENQIDTNEVVKINNRRLELKEKNNTIILQNNTCYLKILKSDKIFDKISVMVQINSNLVLQKKADMTSGGNQDNYRDSPTLHLIEKLLQDESKETEISDEQLNETEDLVNEKATENSDIQENLKKSDEQLNETEDLVNEEETENSDIQENLKKSDEQSNETENSDNEEATEKSDSRDIKEADEQPTEIKGHDNKKETGNSDNGNIKETRNKNGFKSIISLMSYPQIVLSLILIFS